MPRYAPELVEEIRVATDIVDLVSTYVPLKQKGNRYWGLCPFHHEKTASFSVNPEKQLYYCFGCGASGNAYGFLMQMENIDFPEAVRRLAERAHIPLPEEAETPAEMAARALKERLKEMHSAAGRFYYECLHGPEGRVALTYLENRQISPAIARRFGLGYAPGREQLRRHLEGLGYTATELEKSGLFLPGREGGPLRDRFYERLMFPIFDGNGRCIGFGGRILGKGEPKYLNSPETVIFNKSQTLYGLHFAKKTRKRELILVEGYMDLLTVVQAGFPNVVAGLGTALNQEHVRVLQKVCDSVILLYDSDEAGRKAAQRAIPLLLAGGLGVRVASVPDGKDPDEFIKAHGPQAFARVIAAAQSHTAFAIDCIRRNYNLQNPEHLTAFATEVAHLLAQLPNPIEAEVYAREVAQETGLLVETLLGQAKKERDRQEAAFAQKAEKQRLRLYEQTPAPAAETAKGVLEAQKDLLATCVEDEALFGRVLQYLSPADFPTPALSHLAELMADCLAQDLSMVPGELVNHFTDPEEQRLISGLFARKREPLAPDEQKKALREEILLIKRAKLEKDMESADILRLQALVEQKKKLDHLDIEL